MKYLVTVNGQPIDQYVYGVNKQNALYQAEAWARTRFYIDEDGNRLDYYTNDDVIGVR